MAGSVTIERQYRIWEACATDFSRPTLTQVHLVKGWALASDGFILAAVPATYAGDPIQIPAAAFKAAAGNPIIIEDASVWTTKGQGFRLVKPTQIPHWLKTIPAEVELATASLAFDPALMRRLCQAIGLGKTPYNTAQVYRTPGDFTSIVIPGAGEAIGVLMPMMTTPHPEQVTNALTTIREALK